MLFKNVCCSSSDTTAGTTERDLHLYNQDVAKVVTCSVSSLMNSTRVYGYKKWLSGHTIPFQIQFTCISTTQKTNCLPCPTAECIFSTSNLIFDLPGVLNIFSQINVTSFKHGVISS